MRIDPVDRFWLNGSLDACALIQSMNPYILFLEFLQDADSESSRSARDMPNAGLPRSFIRCYRDAGGA